MTFGSEPFFSDDARRRAVLRRMIRSRAFETALGVEFEAQRDRARNAIGGRNSAFEEYNAEYRIPIQGNLELAIGQEAAPAALCEWLRTDDYAAGTHRSHALAISKGVEFYPILAEIYGREGGLCGGRAGDFMLHDVDVNFENSAIMGQLTAVALGHAFARKKQGSDAVAAVAIGDGASNQGVVHESMNLASLWRLPVIYLIEDNQYAISTHASRSSAVADLSRRALGYDMPAVRLDDRDVDELIIRFGQAVDRARRGEGPSLVVVRTRRLRGAFEGDNQSYRHAGELASEEAANALDGYERQLVASGVVEADWRDRITAEVALEFKAALRKAEASELPKPATATEGLFA